MENHIDEQQKTNFLWNYFVESKKTSRSIILAIVCYICALFVLVVALASDQLAFFPPPIPVKQVSNTTGRRRRNEEDETLWNPQVSESLPKIAHHVRFEDVGGIDEVLDEFREVVDYLKHPEKYKALGVKPPKGILCYGPPGTGKTLLAKAVAGEAGCTFMATSGSEFVEKWVGLGAARVRDLFQRARLAAPALIFIDEIDAIGAKRTNSESSCGEREQTLNQILVEMDGFYASEKPVLIIAATNRIDMLDAALLRSGRFDKKIYVPLPDLKGRAKILQVHAKKLTLDKDVNLQLLAKQTVGFSGADLSALLNQAALLAARRNASKISMKTIIEVEEQMRYGLHKKDNGFSEKERKTTAIHEAGHALAEYLLNPTAAIQKVTIVGHMTGIGGFSLALSKEDKHLDYKIELKNRLIVLLAGRAAEEEFCEDVSSGASQDLAEATRIAHSMICELGLGKTLVSTKYSQKPSKKQQEEIEQLLEESYFAAKNLVQSNRSKLKKLSNALLEKETLDRHEIHALLK